MRFVHLPKSCTHPITLSIDSAESLKDKLADFEEELRVWGSLKEIYRYSFDFAKDPMQKAVGKILYVVHRSCSIFFVQQRQGDGHRIACTVVRRSSSCQTIC